ncbi:MAG: RNA-binding protein [Beijerinckiaceae bacterium]|nr:RNA-binding protein [Beijerinckiaceae bacterium]
MDDALDDGPDRTARTRLCAATREVRPVDQLLRFVRAPDGLVVPDIRSRLPGRGVWITARRDSLRRALERQVFARHFRQPVIATPELIDRTADLLRQDALQMLALCNKAGAVTSGFAKIEGMRPPILALVQAKDGSEAEKLRLQGLCRGRGPRRSDPKVILAFASDELGLSIGREHVIHAALSVHDAASVFVERALRFVEFQAHGPAVPQAVPDAGAHGVPASPLQDEGGAAPDPSSLGSSSGTGNPPARG